MARTHNIKAVLFLFLSLSLVACSRDDTPEQNDPNLVGEWERSDSNDTFNYQITFEDNNFGFETSTTIDPDTGQGTSSAKSFEWEISNNQITLDFGDETVTSQFTINSNGELLLNNFSEFYFTRL